MTIETIALSIISVETTDVKKISKDENRTARARPGRLVTLRFYFDDCPGLCSGEHVYGYGLRDLA